MTFVEWLTKTVTDIRQDGIGGARNAGFQLYKGAFRRLDWIRDGTAIYERDWDVLVVLDACRYDLMGEVVDEYDYIESFAPFWSKGSSSTQWMQKNFTEDWRAEMAETIHVTGNPRTERSLPNPTAFRILDEVWKYAWDDEIGTIYPDPITDRAIFLHREHEPARMVVHYMQPHHPFVGAPIGDGVGGSTDPWIQLREGSIDRDEVWRRYRDNLEYALDSLPKLLRNIDADDVIITADHGNLLGRFGLYGHPAHVALKELRKVPWCKATARNVERYEPTLDRGEQDLDSEQVTERLRDLGYV